MPKTILENLLDAVGELKFKFPIAKISKDTSYSAGIVSEYLNGKKEISEKFLRKFCEVYNYDYDELINVNNKVSKGNNSPSKDRPPSRDDTNELILLLKSTVAKQDAEIISLKKQLEDLQGIQKSLDLIIGNQLTYDASMQSAHNEILKVLAKDDKHYQSLRKAVDIGALAIETASIDRGNVVQLYMPGKK